MQNTHEKQAWRLLWALYELARGDRGATPANLTDSLGVSEREIDDLLKRLEGQGLVDADGCRLTMQGLVLAVSIGGRQRSAPIQQAA